MPFLPLALLAGLALFVFGRPMTGVPPATPPRPPPPPQPTSRLGVFDTPQTHYFYIWVLVRGCTWQFVQADWNLDGVPELTAARWNAPTFYWMWDNDKYFKGQNPWTSGIVDRFRAQSIDCCKQIGGC